MPYQHILLIDDDDEDAEIFLTAVNSIATGVNYTILHNAEEALNKLVLKQIRPDLIFLDLNMPVMNGQQFLIEIKKNQELKTIPVIIFSTSSHATTMAITKELGAQDFITKPDNYDALVKIFRPLLS